MLTAALIAIPLYAVVSLTTFIAFALDKRRAQRDIRRIPEATLHLLELLGGFPGAFLAMKFLRHKNRKPRFIAITFAVAALHILLWTLAIYLHAQA